MILGPPMTRWWNITQNLGWFVQNWPEIVGRNQVNKKWLVIAGLFASISLPAQAQIREISGTPRATVDGAQIGVWADQYGMGLAGTFGAEKGPAGWGGSIYASPGSEHLLNDVMAEGGAVNYINLMIRPGLNNGFVRRFPATGAGPSPTGDAGADAINLALQQNFKLLVGADGKSVTLVPK